MSRHRCFGQKWGPVSFFRFFSGIWLLGLDRRSDQHRYLYRHPESRFRSVSIIALLPTLPIPLRLNCRRFPLPKCLPFGSPHAALSAWLWPPESFPHCHRRLESAASVFASTLISALVRCAPHCGHRSADDQAPHRRHLVCRCLFTTCVAGLSSTWLGLRGLPPLIIGAPPPNPAAAAVRRWLPCTFVLRSDRHGEE